MVKRKLIPYAQKHNEPEHLFPFFSRLIEVSGETSFICLLPLVVYYLLFVCLFVYGL